MHQKNYLQKCITLSSTETEHIAIFECARTFIQLCGVLQELGLAQEETYANGDSARAVTWAKKASMGSSDGASMLNYVISRWACKPKKEAS